MDPVNALQIYLQIISENVFKNSLNVLEIVNSKDDVTGFNEFKNTVQDMSDVKIKYDQMQRNQVLSMRDQFVSEVDLVVVQDLASDDQLCQMLYRILPRDTFIISKENIISGQCVRPSNLYRVVSSINSHHSKLNLVKWRPTQPSAASSVVSVRTQSDLELLKSTRSSIPQKHKLVILSTYPAVPGLQELVKKWKMESDSSQIYVVMVSNKDDLDQLPDLDLTFNILQNKVWGGEYSTSWQEQFNEERGFMLRSGQLGDLDSLHWVEAPEPTGDGVPVKVHYTALNMYDVKRATGEIPFMEENENETSYGMDVSGVTDSGERVMGIVTSGAASGRVCVRPELIWPVPDHWSLEDAATVPSSYLHAFYCLSYKLIFQRGLTIMVHGGAGALGQAMIAVALAHGCKVFTTVSDIRKKRFLMRLFPDLREDYIGNSRDRSFADMVLNATKGNGCNVVISCVKGELKDASITCSTKCSILLDVSLVKSRERYLFGMANLNGEKNYCTVDLTSIFNNEDNLKNLQQLLADGIHRGFVRPLSRVSYAPHEAPRAFRLLAASRHRGRVLLRVREQAPSVRGQAQSVRPRLTCSSDRCHAIISNGNAFGLYLVDTLIKRGATKILLHFNNVSTYLQLKMQHWNKLGVKIHISTQDLNTNKGIQTLLTENNNLGPMEGIYVINTNVSSKDDINAVVANLDAASRKLCSSLRYFAVLSSEVGIGQQTCQSRVLGGLPATNLVLPKLAQLNDVQDAQDTLSWHAAVNAMDHALRSSQPVLIANPQTRAKQNLLQQIAHLAEVNIPEDVDGEVTLLQLGMDLSKVTTISAFLSNTHNTALRDEDIPNLSIEKIQTLEEKVAELQYKPVRGLDKYFSYVDNDELLATTEMVFLQTMISNATMRDDEYDVNQTHICIVPGLENHHEKFREMCSRLKAPTFVMQPNLDRLQDNLTDMAKRFAEGFLQKFKLKDNFYLVGYECGVIEVLEMAAILEEQGYTGTVYCIGGAPEEIQATLENDLREYDTEEDLQNNVLGHMFSLMTKSTAGIEGLLKQTFSWREKVERCVRMLLGTVPHSAQYARALIDAAYTRIGHARNYRPQPKPLRSQLVLLRASSMTQVTVDGGVMSSEQLLQRYSQKPVKVYDLRAPLEYAAQDMRCASIINRHLDEELLEAYEKRNMCESYLLNADIFMTTA